MTLEPLALIRAVHYTTLFMATGALAFSAFVAVPSFPRSGGPAAFDAAARRQHRLVVVAAVTALITAALWLVAETQSISGRSLAAALSPALLAQVLGATVFGQVWLIRFALLAALAIAVAVPPTRAREFAGIALGIAATATLAFAGHAAAADSVTRAGDMIHLVLGALWLGSLPPLADLLGAAARGPAAATAIMARCCRRFSGLGTLCVTGLLATGLLNAWSLVGSIPGFIGTGYGRLLGIKIALVLVMVALAAVNRRELTPALAGAAEPAQRAARRLARNALLEFGLGVLVLVDVGALGIAVPATHDQVIWPLPVIWSLGALASHPLGQVVAVAAALLALAGVAALGRGTLGARHRLRWLAGGGALVLGALAVAGNVLAEAAVPTVYATSPLPYSTSTIAAGARIYADQCLSCHGPKGYGDGEAAASLPVKPADLARQHVGHHTDGTLFWWVTHGKGESAMPAFEGVLDPLARWQALAYLHALHDAETARGFAGAVDPAQRVPAPDFAFERAGAGQETLSAERGREDVLLVLYTAAQSDRRLDVLAKAEGALDSAGLRVVAVPMAEPARAGTIFAPPDATLAAIYELYCGHDDGAEPGHMEFLIDRWGYLRARWQGDGASPDGLMALVIAMAEEPEPPPLASGGHSH